MSGITISTPGKSSSGKVRPASTMTISSLYSSAVMFFPISPTPPRNVIFNLLLFIFSPFFIFKTALQSFFHTQLKK